MSLRAFTIDSDDEIEPEEDSSSEIEENFTKKPKSKGNKKKPKKSLFTFRFDDGGVEHNTDADGSSDDDAQSDDEPSEQDTGPTDNVRMMPHADERSVRAKEKNLKKGADGNKKSGEGVSSHFNIADSTSDGMNENDEAEYFDSIVDAQTNQSNGQGNDKMFSELSLSRSLLRGIEVAGYVSPTPVQAAVIPLALAGRDVCASAVTGSGKTAAFVLPFLERLLFRRKDVAAIRVLVITPTRELATQIFTVLQKLSQFTDITCALICGGKKDVKSQEATLRLRPDVVVCTPGRFIDHLRNSHCVNIDDLDVLVLDEVDRLLDLGFQDEVEELVKHCPTSRQTLLFSATMTPKVEDLAKLSLRKPIRVKTAASTTTVAPRLVQEFIKMRNESEREGILAALICRSFHNRCIAFFETKHETHRFYTILRILDIKVCELHGDVSQVQRYLALEKFRKGEVDVMVATDVAARGLDIPGVQTVLNAEMPRTASTYVHRVGRTARAGCGGRSITLVSDARRKVMKEVLKNYVGGEGGDNESHGGQVLSRTVPAPIIAQYVSRIKDMEEEIVNVMKEEKMQARLRNAESEVERAENMIMYEDEIAARPARTWYQTESQKQSAKEVSRKRAQEEGAILAARGDETEDRDTTSARQKNPTKAPVKELTAFEKAKEFARRGDYRFEIPENGKKPKELEHRLSRQKRRRLEALKELEEDNDKSISLAPKRAKTAVREAEASRKDLSLGEIGLNKRTIKNESGVKKIIRPKFAVGGLDQDFYGDSDRGIGGASLSKKQAKLISRKGEKEFSEFDPNKRLRKQGKISNNSFKSKSKFKRRK